MSEHDPSLFVVKKAAQSGAWAPGEIAAVLMEGAVPEQFAHPPQALLSDCTSITAVVSGLDNRAVEYIRHLLSKTESPELRIVLLVHATCPTENEDLLTLLNTNGLKGAWVLPVRAWGQRCSWVLAIRRNPPTHILWNSSAGNFGMSEPAVDEAHLVIEADTRLTNEFVSWFSRLVAASAPLTAETAQIPALVAAPGTPEGAETWEQYAARCRAAVSEVLMTNSQAASSASSESHVQESVEVTELVTSSPAAFSSESSVLETVEVVEKKIREELKIPKPDPLLQPLVQLFEQGDLITIDKGSRIPPLEVPIKAEWFGISSFREVGVVSREVRYKISVLDEKANKTLDARRNDTSTLLVKFSYPLADGSRWMPHKAKNLFGAELKRKEEEGKKLLESIVSGNSGEWVNSKRDLVSRDANRQYEEFHPGKQMPEETIEDILKALTLRFQKATAGNFLPKVGFVKTSFRLGGGSEHVSDWATARTLLRAIAAYPRAGLKSRAFFLRGLQVSEKDLLEAMNVADDRLVDHWFQPEAVDRALQELEVLEQIDESEQSDHDKCGLILDLLHRNKPLDIIRNLAERKAE